MTDTNVQQANGDNFSIFSLSLSAYAPAVASASTSHSSYRNNYKNII